MKKIIVMLITLCMLAALCGCSKYDESRKGEAHPIRWEEVNLREEPSDKSDILSILYEGDEVTLTGNFDRSLSGEDIPQNDWVEIITAEGTTGWIVQESIDWMH